MEEILNQYLQFLWRAFQYDMTVFSQGWLYAWVLVPAFGYLIFFMLKWTVLTAPIWIPFRIIFQGLKSVFGIKNEKKEE